MADRRRDHGPELRRLRARLAALHEESIPTAFARKQGIGMLLAMRRWEPASFRELRKKSKAPS